MRLIIKFSFFLLLLCVLFSISCQKKFLCPDCTANQPPVSNAGQDQIIVLPVDTVMLDATASADPDGTITSYQWLKISGPSFNIITADSSKTLVKNLVMGVYRFELTVTDIGGLSAKDTVQIIVNDPAVNQPPIANAGTDTTITLPTDSVSLNGNLSFDPDGTIVSYQWTKISGPSFTFINGNAVQTQVVNLLQGVYEFELTVTDNKGLSAKDTLQITVNTAPSTNLPPIANAGSDISVNYNLQTCSITSSTITLNGSASSDTDGTIVDYFWSQLPDRLGPPAATMLNPSSANTPVTDLITGTYYFILRVTDNSLATDEDTVLVNVINLMNRPLVQAQLIPIGTLSQTRLAVAAGAANNKIVFAGGWPSPVNTIPSTTRADIYDITTGTWSTSELTEGRFGIGVAVLDNKIFFAGGGIQQDNGFGAWQYSGKSSAAIDIFDAATNTWSTAQLSSARSPVGAAADNKVIFAGGDDNSPSSKVDIYDAGTNSWSAISLSEVKHINQAATSGDKIFFAGGSAGILNGPGIMFKKIDIYDALPGTWSVDALTIARGAMAAISANNKVYWAGGFLPDSLNEYSTTNSVEIKNLATNATTFDCLSEPKAGLTAVRKDNKIIFYGGNTNKFDIYDLTTNSWSIGVLPLPILWGTILSYNDIVYIAGAELNGNVSNQVWKLDF